MQNRIEELIKICTERVPYYTAGNDGHPEYSIEFNKQKFAELLIKECITKCKTDWHGDSLDDICVQMLEHFEIKE